MKKAVLREYLKNREEKYNMVNGLGEVVGTVSLNDIKIKEDTNAKTVKIKAVKPKKGDK